MNGQYRHLTEKPPVDMKEIYRSLKSSNLPAATEGLVVAACSRPLKLFVFGIMSATFSIEMSVPLAACAVYRPGHLRLHCGRL